MSQREIAHTGTYLYDWERKRGKPFQKKRSDLLIAGRDPVATEFVGCIVAGEDPLSIEPIAEARAIIKKRRTS